ncbi:AzlC family ABC transporter permease [Mangrovitalea sediminis]|uniref:AzlC family ABC transporter permease n=1 Tax=Mangrovitalea sediminis TaxID=1982043 RepID=UPI000BE4E406|nr:AzlC family ABC transporter permease [Mangrovitalea sediminis]
MMTQNNNWLMSDYFAGIKAGTPIWLSMFAFGIVAGILGVKLGLSPLDSASMSLIMYTGSGQVATLQLFHEASPPLIILVTVLVVNLRFVMYSASLAPHFEPLNKRQKLIAGYLLSDQAFIVSLLRYQRGEVGSKYRFYLGAALSLWAIWQLGTLVGAFTGAQIPASWGMELAAPLTFLALMFSALRDKPGVAAAAVSGVVAVSAAALPWHLNMLLGALAGVVTGMVLSR